MKWVSLIILSTAAFGQNVRFDGVAQTRSGQPAPGAFVAVCTQPANTTPTPCAPLAALCNSLTDITCTEVNPVRSDGLGNFHFYAKSSSLPVTLQFYGPSLTSYIMADQSSGGNSGGNIDPGVSVAQVPVWNVGANKYSPQTKAIVDARDYSGADWCAQVNAADTAFAGVTAILRVPSSMSGLAACTTTITITSSHTLQFEKGTFALGTLSGRPGIMIGPAVNNASVVGAGVGQTTLKYTSVNLGAGNGFPNGSAIGLGRVTGCTNDAAADNYIRIAGLSIVDLNTIGALGAGHSPAGIDGACVNFLTIENNEFTDIKGNGAITVLGLFGTGGGNTYYNRNNMFDGTVAGGGGEFTADNSTNWTHYYVLNNTVSRWPCAFGVARATEGLISGNTVDATLKAPFSGCGQIGIGAGSDTSGTLGNIWIINNVLIMGFSGAGISLLPNPTLDNTLQIGMLGNNIHLAAGSSETGIALNGANAGHLAPTMIVRGNTVSTDFGASTVGVLNSVDFSDNVFTGINGGVPFFDCTGSSSIAATGLVRVYNNRATGTLTGGVAKFCTDATYSTRQFQEWGNTINNGNLDSVGVASGFLGQPTKVTWTPGTIAAYTSTGVQTATVTQAIVGDTVTIVNANGSTNWLSLPAGVIACGTVTSANTVSFTITNMTAAAVTVNSGSAIQSYAIVDRPPNNAQTPCPSLNGTINVAGGSSTSAQVGPVTARTGAVNGTPSVIIQEETGANPLEIHVTHQTGIDMYSHDATSGLRSPAISFLRSRGTQASPGAVLNGDLLSVINIGGYDGTVYAGNSLIKYSATESWNGTSHGTGATFAVVPNGGTTTVNSITLNPDGSTTFLGALQLASVLFANLPTSSNGTMLFCSDCKNVTDDTTGTFDSVAASGGHGTIVLRENGTWRVH